MMNPVEPVTQRFRMNIELQRCVLETEIGTGIDEKRFCQRIAVSATADRREQQIEKSGVSFTVAPQHPRNQQVFVIIHLSEVHVRDNGAYFDIAAADLFESPVRKADRKRNVARFDYVPNFLDRNAFGNQKEEPVLHRRQHSRYTQLLKTSFQPFGKPLTL